MPVPGAWATPSTSGHSRTTSHHRVAAFWPFPHGQIPNELRTTWSGDRKTDLGPSPIPSPNVIFSPWGREKKQHQCQHTRPAGGVVPGHPARTQAQALPGGGGGGELRNQILWAPRWAGSGAWTDVYRRRGLGEHRAALMVDSEGCGEISKGGEVVRETAGGRGEAFTV